MSHSALAFAAYLEVEDIQQIYRELKRKVGAVRAASICGIARSTPHRWSESEYIRPQTKTRVLKGCIEEVPIKSFEILTERGTEQVGDLILTYLSVVYHQALNQNNPEQFSQKFNFFQELREKFRGIIENTVEEYVRDMLQILINKADSMDIHVTRDNMSTITNKNLLEILPYMIEDVFLRRQISDISRDFRIDINVPQSISEAVQQAQWRIIQRHSLINSIYINESNSEYHVSDLSKRFRPVSAESSSLKTIKIR